MVNQNKTEQTGLIPSIIQLKTRQF